MCDERLWEGIFMDMRRLQDEINVELVVPAATDEVLVAAAKLEDCGAVDATLEYSIQDGRRIMGNRDDAEDVIQDAWMKTLYSFESF